MQGRVADARQEVTRAWQEIETRHDLTSARILTLRLMIALVDGEPDELFLGQLKTHLAIQPLPNFADVDRRWQITRMLDALTPRLDAGALLLLRAIGDVHNGDRTLESLGEAPVWQAAPLAPLDLPWPGEGPGITHMIVGDVADQDLGDTTRVTLVAAGAAGRQS